MPKLPRPLMPDNRMLERIARQQRRLDPGGAAGDYESVGRTPTFPRGRVLPPHGSGGGHAYFTLNVAASDSTDVEKAGADYVCDGVDDDVEIQAALDFAAANGRGTVRLMSGHYYIGTTVAIVRADDEIALIGQSTRSTVLVADGLAAGDPVINVYGGNAGVANLRIFDNPAGNGIELGGPGFPEFPVRPRNARIVDVEFDTMISGIKVTHLFEDLWVTGCRFVNLANPDTPGDCGGIDSKSDESGGAFFLDQAFIIGNEFGNDRDGVIEGWGIRAGTGYSAIADNVFYSCWGGIGPYPEYSTITGNVFFDIENNDVFDPTNIDLQAMLPNGDCIQVVGEEFLLIANNQTDSPTGYLVNLATDDDLDAGCENIVISGNNGTDCAGLLRTMPTSGIGSGHFSIHLVANSSWFSYGPGSFGDDEASMPAAVSATNLCLSSITGNNLLHSSSDAIRLHDSWDNLVASNAIYVLDPDTGIGGQTNDRAAIHISGNSDRNFVTANLIRGSADDSGTGPADDFGFGVWIEDSTCTDNIVVGNDLRPFPGGSWYVDKITDGGTGTLLSWPNDPTYGDNFT